MKPPYYPPNDKMIKDAAIRAMEKEARPILDEVVVSKNFLIKKKYKLNRMNKRFLARKKLSPKTLIGICLMRYS